MRFVYIQLSTELFLHDKARVGTFGTLVKQPPKEAKKGSLGCICVTKQARATFPGFTATSCFTPKLDGHKLQKAKFTQDFRG
ncbi:hypothetical protein RSOLAG1IB_00160 [Rhizoctonia solani AG-1 IB]|uniref:Uncharacterized protein n=1 Tax=Thanatephorus cucumeris (strain AG1-IB / isolate 7/3/14) TaxID=1108050 RepID=A0A0B7F2C0_THACB|nr:hypothetical protein RSOLAG1IB_00160 [Rhizoctonia solani AG-1 IB]